MKKIIFLAAATCMICGIANAQVTKQNVKDQKVAVAAINAKSSRDAKKEAKKLAKEGWQVAPGHLTMEKQLDRAYAMQMEYDDTQMPKYIMGEAITPGKFYDAAKMQAIELAKENLAGQIQTEVTKLIETTVANDQISQDDAESIAKTVGASKDLISQSLGRVITVVECYRTLANKNVEVRVMLAYNQKMAMEAAKTTIKKQLEEKGQDLHDQLDKLLGFGNM